MSKSIPLTVLAVVALAAIGSSGVQAAWFDITGPMSYPYGYVTHGPYSFAVHRPINPYVMPGTAAVFHSMDVAPSSDLTLYIWADATTATPNVPGDQFINIGLDVIPEGTGTVTSMHATVVNPGTIYTPYPPNYYNYRWQVTNVVGQNVPMGTAGNGIDDMTGNTSATVSRFTVVKGNITGIKEPTAYHDSVFLHAILQLHVTGTTSQYINLYLGTGASQIVTGPVLVSPLYFGHDASFSGPELYNVPDPIGIAGTGPVGGRSLLPEFVIHIVPEPATMGIMGLGTLGLGFLRRRRR